MAKGKRKLRKGSKDVAIAYTEARKIKRAVKIARMGKEKGGFNKRKPTYARRAELEALQVVEQNRWPDDEQLIMYHELNIAKKPRTGRIRKPIKPRVDIFPLMDEISDVTRNRMLIAASLKMQPVKRSPGWILSRTYNHKNRPITFV